MIKILLHIFLESLPSGGGQTAGRGEGGETPLQASPTHICIHLSSFNLNIDIYLSAFTRQAWAEAKQTKESSRRASLAKSLQVRSRAASPEYDVSLATASYEYDVITP